MICNGGVTADDLKALAARAKCTFPEDCSDCFDRWAADITRDAKGRMFSVVWVMFSDRDEVKSAGPSVKWLN